MILKTLRKGTVVALALTAVLSFAACGNSAGGNPSNQGNEGNVVVRPQKQYPEVHVEQPAPDIDDITNVDTDFVIDSLETSGTITSIPATINAFETTITDSNGGQYLLSCKNLQPRAATSTGISGTWQYKKDNKVYYEGNFTGDANVDFDEDLTRLFSLRFKVQKALSPGDVLTELPDEVPFTMTFGEDSFSATIPEIDIRGETIRIWAFTNEFPGIVEKYTRTVPGNGINRLTVTIIATTDGSYIPALNTALENGEVDLFVAESAFVSQYTKGWYNEYVLPYKELGITQKQIDDAQLAPYAVDMGTNDADGKLYGLSYEGAGCCFIYRRSIAKEVFGTDDPDEICELIGGGTGSLDKFTALADELKAKNYTLVSTIDDLWHEAFYTAEKSWISEGKLYIDPKREAFFDMAKALYDADALSGKDGRAWTDNWYADMSDRTEKPCFGFFGPEWLINFVLQGNAMETKYDWAVCQAPVPFSWGDTWVLASKSLNESGNENKKYAIKKLIEWMTLDTSDTGFLYQLATGTFQWTFNVGKDTSSKIKDAVPSSAVMKKATNVKDFFAGQDIHKEYNKACQATTGCIKLCTQYDESINYAFLNEVLEYITGKKTKEKALADFKAKMKDQFELESE